MDQSTAERLRSTPGVQRVPAAALDLFVVRNFLSAQQCAALIERIDARRRPSEIADDLDIRPHRVQSEAANEHAALFVEGVPTLLKSIQGFFELSTFNSPISRTFFVRIVSRDLIFQSVEMGYDHIP